MKISDVRYAVCTALGGIVGTALGVFVVYQSDHWFDAVLLGLGLPVVGFWLGMKVGGLGR